MQLETMHEGVTPAIRASLLQGMAAIPLGLNAAQQEMVSGQLLAYLALLSKWNKVYNLTAVRDIQQMVTLHLLDTLAAVTAFDGARSVLDVGAGGGLPGLVLAIWAAQTQPDMHVSLIDTVNKKTAFLTQVKVELQLSNVSVHTARVEQLTLDRCWQGKPFDVITSRAFAELGDFINWSQHLLAPSGHYIALKGLLPDQEINHLPPGWKIQRVQVLEVPQLQAERHLIFIERTL